MDETIQMGAQDLLHNGLANHEEILMKGVLKAHPPLVLARNEVSFAECRARCRSQ